MDAKPHRPTRTLKLRDENVPPSAIPGAKTLHQRNKSTPALSTLAQVGGFRFGAKRSAFADLSNTTRNSQPARDDSALYGKKGLSILEEVPALERVKSDIENVKAAQDCTKHASFSRPAQRPLSVSGIKGFLSNLSSGNSQTNATKPVPASIVSESIPQQLSLKAPVPKRSTIFRETVAAPVPVQVPPPEAVSIPISESQQSTDLYTNKPLPEEPKSSEQTLEPQFEQVQALQKTGPTNSDSLSTIAESTPQIPEDLPIPPITGNGCSNLTSDATQPYSNVQEIETREVMQNLVDLDSPEVYEDAAAHISSLSEGLDQQELLRPTTAIELPLTQIPEELVPESNYPLPGSEFEYWEEEIYDERYDEDGYTTARSLKSRGDYTTGPTTIVLAPRVTAAVERELTAARQYVQDSRTADDIEDDESWDTSMVAEYGDEIFDYMRTLEERMRPNPYYMDNQTEVQWSMRSVLMDWLVQVHHRFSLLPETLFLCVNYIDRFLSCKVVSLGKLQLVGATAIFIAAKYEEINCPSIQEIVYMVDGGYTVDEILKAERFMLSMLQFELGWPGPMSFLRRVSKADDYDLETRTLAKYFLEITIMDERFVGCIPSFTAAGAHCLARLMLKKGSWSQAHVYYSNYTYSQLRPLLSAILSCCEDPQKHHAAIFDKYGDKRFKRASYFVQTEISKGFSLPPVSRISTSSSFSALASTDFGRNDWRITK